MNEIIFGTIKKTQITKRIILLLFLIFGIKSTIANSFKCSSDGMQFFPEQKEISLNPMFIIQGYAYSQKTINSFKDRTIYLESENGELIELNLQEVLKGQMELSQAIFCPVTNLKPNTTYHLKYTNQTEKESKEMFHYNPEKDKIEKVYWKTTDANFIDELNSNLTLEFETTKVVFYGCGPSAYAIFGIKNKSKHEIWYKTEVIEVETNKKAVFYLKEWKGKINVGHGMCSGAFTYNTKGKYKVRFSPMNIDGKSLKTTNWKTFENPFGN